MARKTRPLSDTEVRNAKAKDKPFTLYDGDGLELRIAVSGTKSWVFSYKRPYLNKRNNLKIGTYPDTGLAAARKSRSDFRELLAQNVDPQKWLDDNSDRRRRELSTDFQSVAKKWFEVKFTEITSRHAFNIENSFKNHLFPDIGKIPINDLTAPILINALKPLEASEKLELIGRLCQRVNELMNWCVNVGILEFNKLAGVKAAFVTAKSQNMPTIKPDELPELMAAVSYAQIRITTRCLLEFQLHTMVRPGEAAGARWDEIDFDNKLWNIGPERMKKRRAHSVPLSKQTLAILEFMKPISSTSKYIFPGDRNIAKPSGPETVNRALQRMGFAGRLVSHGFRALASTTLNERGFDHDVIEAALAHMDKDQVRVAYNRAQYVERRRVLMQWWSDHIESAATGNMSMSGKRSLKVV